MEDQLLVRCRTLVEKKLGWGNAEQWTTQDFEELSFKIQEETGQVISATTLKRLWGRVAYDSKPSRHSLDTLAVFAGYTSWRDFTTAQAQTASEPPQIADQTTQRKRAPILVLSLFMLLLGASTVIWLGVRTGNQSNTNENASETPVKFASRQLAFDLPNTIIFEYDVSSLPGDSFFIQQSWDARLRSRVSPDSFIHASTYLYPGYYNAKLIANDSIIKELPVHVKTDEWAVMVIEETPLYLPKASLVDDGTLSVSNTWVKENTGYNLDIDGHASGYYLVQDFGPLHTDNFSLEAVVKQFKPESTRPCVGAQMTIRGEMGAFVVPFDVKGCAGFFRLSAGDVMQSGKNYDLGNLGAEFGNWQDVSLTVKDKAVTIQIGTNPPYELAFTNDIGKVVGLWFLFAGRGALDEIRLKDGNDRVIYEALF